MEEKWNFRAVRATFVQDDLSNRNTFVIILKVPNVGSQNDVKRNNRKEMSGC